MSVHIPAIRAAGPDKSGLVILSVLSNETVL